MGAARAAAEHHEAIRDVHQGPEEEEETPPDRVGPAAPQLVHEDCDEADDALGVGHHRRRPREVARQLAEQHRLCLEVGDVLQHAEKRGGADHVHHAPPLPLRNGLRGARLVGHWIKLDRPAGGRPSTVSQSALPRGDLREVSATTSPLGSFPVGAGGLMGTKASGPREAGV